jgi:hypothetical protein
MVLPLVAAGALSALALVGRVREAVKGFFKSLLSRGSRWSGKP